MFWSAFGIIAFVLGVPLLLVVIGSGVGQEPLAGLLALALVFFVLRKMWRAANRTFRQDVQDELQAQAEDAELQEYLYFHGRQRREPRRPRGRVVNTDPSIDIRQVLSAEAAARQKALEDEGGLPF